jgi:tetratricopeptide (TPR) repeat protein
MSGQIDNAIAIFTMIIEDTNEYADAFLYRGIAYNFLNQYSLAEADFHSAIDLTPRYELARYWSHRNRSIQRHEQIEQLFLLSEDSAEVVENDTKELIVENVIRNLNTVHQYRSQLVVRDLMSDELEDMDFEVIKWSFDYVNPDIYSVTQFTVLEDFPNGKSIRWISSGTDSINTIFIASVKTSRQMFNSQIENFISIDKYIDILSMRHSEKVSISRAVDDRYYLLKIGIPFESVLGDWRMSDLRRRLARSLYHIYARVSDDRTSYEFYALPVVSDVVVPHSIAVNPDLSISHDGFEAILSLWIDVDHYYPVKARILISGTIVNGESVYLDVQQVFSDFNGDVRIIPPIQ